MGTDGLTGPVEHHIKATKAQTPKVSDYQIISLYAVGALLTVLILLGVGSCVLNQQVAEGKCYVHKYDDNITIKVTGILAPFYSEKIYYDFVDLNDNSVGSTSKYKDSVFGSSSFGSRYEREIPCKDFDKDFLQLQINKLDRQVRALERK